MLFLAVLTIAAAAFLVPLLQGGAPLGYDWDYFNSLSLVIRSSVISFGKFPLQDPWVMGGLDLLANPQSRILSPTGLLDLALPGPWANLASLLLYAALGALGTFRLLRSEGLGLPPSLAAGALWVNSSWFGLHFAEGHVAFGSLQMMPWILFCLRKPRRLGHIWAYFSLLAFFLLDGGMYSFGLSILLTLAALCFGWCQWQDSEAPTAAASTRTWLLSILVFALLASGKLIPLLSFFRHRETWKIPATIPAEALLDYFFDPFQSPLKPNPFPTPLRYHEYGSYLGWLSAAFLGVSLLKGRFLKRNLSLVLMAALFFWIGAGWGGRLNPWSLFEELPVLNNLRVQSRIFILLHLSLVVLLAHALNELARKRSKMAWIFIAFLLGESLWVRNFPMAEMYRLASRPLWTDSLIRESRWQGTVAWAAKPEHYFQGGHGAVTTYEPVAQPTSVLAQGQIGYLGEAHPDTPGTSAKIQIDRVVPGEVAVSWSGAPSPTRFELNLNWLGGWKAASSDPSLELAPSRSGLISLATKEASGSATLQYRPQYLKVCLLLWAAGVVLWLWTTWRWLRRQFVMN
jgi:hypothetical protein